MKKVKQENSEEELMAQWLYSDEAEKAVIGCMMGQPQEVIEEVINVEMKEEDFFVPSNQVVFRELKRMYQDGENIDVTTIHQWLKDRGLAEDVGSPGCLAEYLTAYATHLNVSSYITIVIEKSILRKLEDAAAIIKKEIANRPDSIAEVLNRAEAAVSFVIDSIPNKSEGNFGLEIKEAALSIFEHAEQGGGLRGLPTGFKKMDELSTGWNPGELIVVAARPGVGKTGLALAFMKTLVEYRFNVESGHYDIEGDAVQMFSMEMNRIDLYMRFYAMKAGVGLMDILTGNLTETSKAKILQAQEDMKRWKMFIDDTPKMDIDLIRARARRACRKNKVAAIFVDYIQLAKSRYYPKDRQNEVAYISGVLKQIARENEVPVIALAQLNRKDADDEDKQPHISNIRDSGAIEQDADKIILLHQDKNADRKIKASDNVKHYKAILAKHRNGRQGTVEMDFEAWRVYFTEAQAW